MHDHTPMMFPATKTVEMAMAVIMKASVAIMERGEPRPMRSSRISAKCCNSADCDRPMFAGERSKDSRHIRRLSPKLLKIEFQTAHTHLLVKTNLI